MLHLDSSYTREINMYKRNLNKNSFNCNCYVSRYEDNNHNFQRNSSLCEYADKAYVNFQMNETTCHA